MYNTKILQNELIVQVNDLVYMQYKLTVQNTTFIDFQKITFNVDPSIFMYYYCYFQRI